jgi:hypothetical protein
MSASTTTPNRSNTELQAELLGIAPRAKILNSSKISTWLNRMFVIVVIIAIPLAYYFGYIGVVALNRIGIILNFCAGFFIAPELIGEKGLHWIELQFSSIRNYLIKRNKIIVEFTSIKSHKLTYYCFVLGWIFYYVYPVIRFYTLRHNISTTTMLYVLIGILFYLLFRFVWRELIERTEALVVKYGDNPKITHDVSATVFLVLALPYLSLISFSAIYVFLPLIQFGSTIFNDDFRSVLVRWGIIFFIVGNLLQFLATF